jgi:hypothetical protein
VQGAVGPHVGAARCAVDIGGDRFEDRLDGLVVGLTIAARHDARTVQRALLAARDAHSEEVDALLSQGGMPALRVTKVRVATVDQHVAGIEVWRDVVDDGIGRLTRLDHAHQHPRPAHRANPALDGLVAAQRSLGTVFVH